MNEISLLEISTLHYISMLGMEWKQILLAFQDNEYGFSYSELEPLLDFKTHLWDPFTDAEKKSLRNLRS